MISLNIKQPLLFAGLLLLSASPLFSQANGPNSPEVGTIIPEEVTFGYSDMSVSEFGNELEALPTLEYVSYGDFPNEIVITVFHTPW